MNARDYAENAQGFLAEDDAEMALSAVVDCLMELTRPEATPPAPAVDDEPGAWVCGACALGSETHGHAASTCVYQPVWRPALVSTPTPTPAPDQPEAAVEALARLLYSGAWYWERVPVGTQDAVRENARHLLAALDRGAVPGYGPTGDRAGEVLVSRDTLRTRIYQGLTGTNEPWGGCHRSEQVNRIAALLLDPSAEVDTDA